jgi:hypothetical protein
MIAPTGSTAPTTAEPSEQAARLADALRRELGWARLEPNAEPLWQLVHSEVEELLIGRWRDGELCGPRPTDAFYVRCGLGETMTQDDVLAGRLVVVVGVAIERPAEFVELAIEQTVCAGRLPRPRMAPDQAVASAGLDAPLAAGTVRTQFRPDAFAS